MLATMIRYATPLNLLLLDTRFKTKVSLLCNSKTSVARPEHCSFWHFNSDRSLFQITLGCFGQPHTQLARELVRLRNWIGGNGGHQGRVGGSALVLAHIPSREDCHGRNDQDNQKSRTQIRRTRRTLGDRLVTQVLGSRFVALVFGSRSNRAHVVRNVLGRHGVTEARLEIPPGLDIFGKRRRHRHAHAVVEVKAKVRNLDRLGFVGAHADADHRLALPKVKQLAHDAEQPNRKENNS